MAKNPRSTGTILLVVGALVLLGALLAAVGWENLGHQIEGGLQSVIAFVGGGMRLVVLIGIVFVATGATVLALHSKA
jgi:hypothetical protein